MTMTRPQDRDVFVPNRQDSDLWVNMAFPIQKQVKDKILTR